ncbi:MAG TPA: amino acid transporter [Actinomycetota bacterium]|nr:amino acid transporter [Actinomycetota bacterium]
MNEAVQILDLLESADVTVWVDGGWGIDALVGAQTREHSDLDLAVDEDDLDEVRTLLETIGFTLDSAAELGLPARLVLKDEAAREVDIHPLKFDDQGNGWQKLSNSGDAWGLYPERDLHSEGRIGDKVVRCLSPELQFRFRLGYEWSDKDRHDIRLLTERFGAGPIPPQS